MDNLSAGQVARELGTNPPRVLRAAERLGIRARRSNGRLEFTARQVEELANKLGVARPVADLSRIEAQVLAALARAPRGLLSVRAIARRAGTSPTATARALEGLEERGLVVRRKQTVALGKVRPAEIWRANVEAPEWSEIAPALAEIRPPVRARKSAQRVPAELRHLFWNTAPSQLDVKRSGGYIARRLIQTQDIDGLAWGAENLAAEDWEHAARTRGLDPAARALARNLALGAKR